MVAKLDMGALCCSKRGEASNSPKHSKRLKSETKDFDSDGHIAAEVLFEMESKDKELDQLDKDALRVLGAKKEEETQAKSKEYKGWKKKADAQVGERLRRPANGRGTVSVARWCEMNALADALATTGRSRRAIMPEILHSQQERAYPRMCELHSLLESDSK
eukprot:COSAG02_NODE_2486_length_8709_cov_5.616725_7_plen_161_part_00